MVWPDIVTENGAVAQKLLKRDDREDDVFDVIVVGSGMGGGVVASALADENKRVLVLEAGSLLFPTHVGNLPRRILIGKFQKHIWSVWNEWQVKNYNNLEGSDYKGAQAFNLGGRSMFWGASIPELAPWELDAFPAEIREYLLNKEHASDTQGKGYKLASQTFNADVPELKDFHKKATNVISEALGKEWTVEPAPVAVEYSGATEWSVPCGIFSTADLLLEDAMVGAHDMPGRHPLCINLNHMVWDINFEGDRATGVNCFDLLERKQKTYHAKAIVLAAGTLESAKIALQSKIPNKLIGQGITDHPIYYRHFTIPPGSEGLSKLGGEPQSTKLIIRHESATLKDHSFDVIVELGAQYNQGRFMDRDHIQDEVDRRQGHMLCEIVFQFYAPLMENNSVTLGGWNKPVNVCMQKYNLPDCVLLEARQVACTILKKLQADKLIDEDSLYGYDGLPILMEAALGGVAHEVGTLRMQTNGTHGVVDTNLKFEGYQNLFACDNSVFPCSPAGNPSLTLVALARRCAKEVARLVHERGSNPGEVCVKPVVIPTGPVKPCDPVAASPPNPDTVPAIPVDVPTKPVEAPVIPVKAPTDPAKVPTVPVKAPTEPVIAPSIPVSHGGNTRYTSRSSFMTTTDVEESSEYHEFVSVETAEYEETSVVEEVTSAMEVTTIENSSLGKIGPVVTSTVVEADAL